jgi:hypothetical protein
LLAALLLHATNYFSPGWRKVEISPHGYEWVVHNPLEYHGRGQLVRGWEPLVDLNPAVDRLRVPAQAFALLVELSGVLILCHQRLAAGLLLLWVALHAGIFLCSGVCFWEWSVLNLALVPVVLAPRSARLFGWIPGAAGAAVVFAGLFPAPRLGWFDTATGVAFDFRVVTDSDCYGVRPLDGPLAPEVHLFLLEEPLPSPGWVQSWDVARAIERGEHVTGTLYFDPARVEQFDRDVRRYCGDFNLRGTHRPRLPIPAPPRHSHAGRCRPYFRWDEPIRAVEVWLVEYAHRADGTESTRRLLRRIAVEPAVGQASNLPDRRPTGGQVGNLPHAGEPY